MSLYQTILNRKSVRQTKIYSCPEFIVLLHTLYSAFQKMSFMGMKKLRTLLKSIPPNKIIGFLEIYK